MRSDRLRAPSRRLLSGLAAASLILACGAPADPGGADQPAPVVAAAAPHPSALFSKSKGLQAELRNDATTIQKRAEPEGLGTPNSVLFSGGMVRIYDAKGQLRVKLLDPDDSFSELSRDPGLNPSESRPGVHPLITVPIGGLSDWVSKRARAARLAAKQRTPILLELANRVSGMEASLASLHDQLVDGWIDASRSATERRRTLFTTWDECEGGEQTQATVVRDVLEIEDPSVALAAYRKFAGDRARRTIERFIREQLPEGSKEGFTKEELQALNAARHSARPFDPYAPEEPLQLPAATADKAPEGPALPPSLR
ncbi:MAG: hypothetical protein KC636_12590 [Myxococcales bacterium]|nr:hypothetical protein [Myxococcales bacterium]